MCRNFARYGCVLVLLSVAACEPPTAPLLDNPYDPDYLGTPIPMAPAGLVLTGSAFGRVDLAWEDHSSFEDAYRIERARLPDTTFAEVGRVGADVTSFIDETVDPNYEYLYRVHARNEAETSASSEPLHVRFAGSRETQVGRPEYFLPPQLLFNASQEAPVLAFAIPSGQLWSAAGMQFIRNLDGARPGLLDLAFSQDGRYLAGGDVGAVHIWHSDDGRLARRLDYPGDEMAVRRPAFSQDATMLAYIWNDTEIRIWRWRDGEIVRMSAPLSLAELDAFTFTPDGTMLVGRAGTSLMYWDVKEGVLSRQVELATPPAPAAYGAFSPDGALVVLWRSGNRVAYWRVEDASFVRELELEESFTGGGPIEFTSDGDLLKVNRSDGVAFYDAEDGHLAFRAGASSEGGVQYGVALSAGGRYLATLLRRGTASQRQSWLRVWDLTQGWEVVSPGAKAGPLSPVAAAGNSRPR